MHIVLRNFMYNLKLVNVLSLEQYLKSYTYKKRIHKKYKITN